MNDVYDYIIVGAGPSAISIYNYLKEQKKKILILEKSRNIGGRIAHRRFKGLKFELGAKKFQATSESLIDLANRGAKQGLLVKNNKTFSAIDSLNEWTRPLIDKKDILNQRRVIRLIKGHNLKLLCDNQETFFAKKVIITAPAAQTYELLKNSGHQLFELNQVRYALDIYYFTRNDKRLKIPSLKEEFCTEVSNNFYQKWSFKEWTEKSRDQLKKELDKRYQPLESHCHKWRYSTVLQGLNKRYQVHFRDIGIYLCGDYFFGNDIQSAFDSAHYLESFI
jgi:predicted NAD/FAD-dependent oxidoreductase